MKLLINNELKTVQYHPCGDHRNHYCIAVLNEKDQPISAHTLPKSWPCGSSGIVKTNGNTYQWAK